MSSTYPQTMPMHNGALTSAAQAYDNANPKPPN
jgi:hypothetical protein